MKVGQQSQFYADELGKRAGADWPYIYKARAEARDKQAELRKILTDAALIPADTSLVVFGSLAREEWTSGSDVDWTLLVDGQAEQNHLTIAQRIRKTLADLKLTAPGPSGVFGGLAFSHDIIHRIGGDQDTNRNTTQRILLLLESHSVAGNEVRSRVVRMLLSRYLSDDQGYHASQGWKTRVPRFLLNDIVRYWRTVAVDFASKRREREDGGWALRNFKLRMSRKLLFAAGLTACLSCQLRPPDNLQDASKFSGPDDFYYQLGEYFQQYLSRPPLETLAETLLHYGATGAARKIFDAYNDFLGFLSDSRRSELKSMSLEDALKSDLFNEAKGIANQFQEGLTEFFFSTDPDLTKATQRYGVF